MLSFSQMPRKHHADATHLLDSGLTSLMRTRSTIQMRKHTSQTKSAQLSRMLPFSRRPEANAGGRSLKQRMLHQRPVMMERLGQPIFQERNRRSTDLEDRFRNSFPHLYQAAGYKPLSTVKKVGGPTTAADDNLSRMSTARPVRNRRRAQSKTGYLGTCTTLNPQGLRASCIDVINNLVVSAFL